MRIVVDLQGAQNGSRFRGIGRYTVAFTKALIRQAQSGGHEVVLALNGLFPETIEPIRKTFDSMLAQEHIVVWHALSPVHFLDAANDARRTTSEVLREAFLASLNPDVVIVSSLVEGAGDNVVTSVGSFSRSVRTAVILYDLIPLLYEKEYLADKRVKAWYSNKIDHMKQADLWFAISESSKEEGIQHLGIPEDRIVNISAAVDPAFQHKEFTELFNKETSNKFTISKSFVMYSGASDPRKNINRLIEAFSRVPDTVRQQLQLVLAGGMPADHRHSLENYVKSVGLSNSDVVFTGHINDDEMLWLYCNCKFYVFPSYHEGFGLPALEAMSCGKAVIGANTSSVPEVIGLTEALFDPFDVEEIARMIERVASDDVFRERLEMHGLSQAKKFSWDNSARTALTRLESEFLTAEQKTVDLGDQLIAALQTIVPQNDEELMTTALCASRILPRSGGDKLLYVDVSELYQRDSRSGIQRVVRSLLKVWQTHALAGYRFCPVYATVDDCYRHTAKFGGEAEILFEEGEPIDPRAGDIFLGLDFQDNIIESKRSYFRRIRDVGVRIYFVVYDLLPINASKYFSSEVCDNYRAWLETITDADGVVCISRSVADELKAWLEETRKPRLLPLHVGWFHLGADLAQSEPSKGVPDNASTIKEQLKARPSFLMVGTLEPRKGYAQALRAFERLWEQGEEVNLVIVGRQGWMVDELAGALTHHVETGKRLFWLDKVSDEFLEQLYEHSQCLVAASEAEGFGLPLIEAAQQGLPLIARDIPVFREVAANQAVYFKGDEPEALTEAVKAWLELYRSETVPDSGAIPWLSWEESGEQLLSTIRDAKWYFEYPDKPTGH